MSKPSLLTMLRGWWEFEEDFNLGHTAMDSSPRQNHIPTFGNENYQGNRYASIGTGRIGGGIKPRYVYALSNTDYNLHGDIEGAGYTLSGWIKLANPSDFIAIAMKMGPAGAANSEHEYELYNNGVDEFTFVHYYAAGNDTVSVTPTGGIQANTWYFVVAWVNPALTKCFIQVNNETPSEIALTGATFTNKTHPFRIGYLTDEGVTRDIVIDNVAIWMRTLTDDERLWLYNSGLGRSYSEIDPAPDPADCEAVTCCDNEVVVGTYTSESATDSGTGSGLDDPCSEEAMVIYDPPCGSVVVFPILVTLTSNYADAVIYYTLDGTTPTEASTVYTGPIEVTGPEIQLKAYASPAACPDGPVYTCNWINPADIALLFQVYCTPLGDHVGAWNDWTPNGQNDINWYFSITTAANLDVQRFELYQCDTLLNWTTGAAWATNTPIVPESPWDQSKTFAVYPLEFDEVGVGVVHSSYQTTWGTITAGSHEYILYGNPIGTMGGIYKLIIILASGQRYYATIPYTSCDDPPPPKECDFPSITSLVPGCQQITVNFNVTAPARNWRVYYKRAVDPAYTLGPIGNGSGALSRTITGLAHGTIYVFYVSQELHEAAYDHCDDWTNSNIRVTSTLRQTTVSISASVAEVESGGTVDITVTSANVPAGGTVTVTNDQTLAGAPCGAHPWTPTPNTTAVCTFTLTATTTWTVTVTGGCTNPTGQVTVEIIEPPAACDSLWVIANPTLEIYDIYGTPAPFIFPPCTNADPLRQCESAGSTAEWDGTVTNSSTVLGTCLWHTGPSPGDIYTVGIGVPFGYQGKTSVQVFLDDSECWGGVAGTNWWIILVACLSMGTIGGVPQLVVIWAGYKALGQNPVGIYVPCPTAPIPSCIGGYVPCAQADLGIRVRSLS